MRVFQLLEDHQGFHKGDKFDGPRIIPGTIKNGYYPIGGDPNSKFCFYQQYVESQPNVFQEITPANNSTRASTNLNP